jgi:hypothetical protein
LAAGNAACDDAVRMLLRPAPDRFRAAWPHLRAGFVTLHCLAVALAAIPSMSGTHPIDVRDSQYAAEVHPWARLLRVSDEAFARTAENLRADWIATHDRWVGPFEQYLALLGTQQPWDMFSTTNRTSARFSVEASPGRGPEPAAADWRLVSGLPAGDWRRPFFESDRTRSFINHVIRRGLWSSGDELCLYLARELLREDSRWQEVRCTFRSEPSPSPPWQVGTRSDAKPRIDHTFVTKRTP